jgi:hypothetical protein
MQSIWQVRTALMELTASFCDLFLPEFHATLISPLHWIPEIKFFHGVDNLLAPGAVGRGLSIRSFKVV